MKKIFLLSLISVLFLSAFSQIASNDSEILAQISITTSADADDEADIELFPWWPRWWFLYKEVYTEVIPGSASIRCEGYGWKMCILKLSAILKRDISGIEMETLESLYQKMIETRNEMAEMGENSGELTRKIAYSDPERNGATSYILIQMNWINKPENPRSGKAEILISKTNRLGF